MPDNQGAVFDRDRIASQRQLIARIRAAAQASNRLDLLRQLSDTDARIEDPTVRVAVVGLRNKGKSSVVNGVLAQGDYIADGNTTVETVVRWSDRESAEIITYARDEDPTSGIVPTVRTPIAIEQVRSDLNSSALTKGRNVVRLEVGIPSPILATGLTFVDTPGNGGRHVSPPHLVSIAAAADATVFVTDSSQEFTAPEVEFLRQIVKVCPTTAVVMTKSDVYPEWRRILDTNRHHLERAGIAAGIGPLSNVLRRLAIELDDPELTAESGYPAFLGFLRNAVVADAAANREARLAQDLYAVIGHLKMPLQAELESLSNPEYRDELYNAVRLKREQSDARAKSVHSWQQVLSDSMTTLVSEVDFRLRQAIRSLNAFIDSELEHGDADKKWPELSQRVEDAVNEIVADNLSRSMQGAQDVAARVAASFEAEQSSTIGPSLAALSQHNAQPARGEIGTLSALKKSRVADRALTTMRGGQGGAAMVFISASLFGVSAAALAPFAIGAAVVLGAKALKDDKETRASKRRSEAARLLHKYVDDVSFQVGQQSRDRLIEVQRTLRDHFRDRAEQEINSIQSALKAAQDVAELELADRDRRKSEVRRGLVSLDELSAAVERVTGR